MLERSKIQSVIIMMLFLIMFRIFANIRSIISQAIKIEPKILMKKFLVVTREVNIQHQHAFQSFSLDYAEASSQ